MGACSDLLTGFAKYILFLFNLLILVAAAIFIAMAVKFNEQNSVDMKSLTIFPIVLGVIIALIAFFGCCGAVRESSCMLTTYASILIVLFIIQLALGILAFVALKQNNGLEDTVGKYLKNIYENRNSTKSYNNQKVVDELQKSLQCCGLTNKTDNSVTNGTHLIQSCCESVNPCTVASAYNEGCTSKLTEFLQGITKTIGIVAITFGAIELLAAIFACYVKKSS